MDLQAAMAAHAPIIITAPSARNGVTLIQRLLNSTRRIIVYGENTMIVDHLPNGALMAVNDHQRFGHAFDASRERFTTQTTEYWSSDLWPDSARFLLVMYHAYKNGLDVYAQSSKACGFDRWGVKNPMTNPLMINRIRALLPNARFIVTIRDPFDVIRSAKARNFVKTPDDVATYARNWGENVQSVLKYQFDNQLVIPYDAMMREPEAWLDKLERFTDLPGIDRTVMDRKINSFDGYTPPAGLTREETAYVERYAGEAMAEAGIGAPKPDVTVLPNALSPATAD